MLCEPDIPALMPVQTESGVMHIDLYAYIAIAGCVIALGASVGVFAVSLIRRDRPPMA